MVKWPEGTAVQAIVALRYRKGIRAPVLSQSERRQCLESYIEVQYSSLFSTDGWFEAEVALNPAFGHS